MGRMVAHPGQPLDHHRNPLQRPQLADKPVSRGALEQHLLDLGELLVRQPGVPARRGRGFAAHRYHWP
jgi:hypothetical protein